MRRMFALHSSCIVRSSQILKKYSLVGNVLRKSSNAAVVATNQTQDGKLCDIIGKDNSGRNEEMSRKPKGLSIIIYFVLICNLNKCIHLRIPSCGGI